jgi:hypothetical protein
MDAYADIKSKARDVHGVFAKRGSASFAWQIGVGIGIVTETKTAPVPA